MSVPLFVRRDGLLVDTSARDADTSQRDSLTRPTPPATPETTGPISGASESPLRSFTAGVLVGFGRCLVLVAFAGVLR